MNDTIPKTAYSIQLSSTALTQVIMNFKNTLLHYQNLCKEQPDNENAKLILSDRVAVSRELLSSAAADGFPQNEPEYCYLKGLVETLE